MALDLQRLIQWREPPRRQAWSVFETIRYALGLGIGSDPLDEGALRFVYEEGLQSLPTLATVLAAPFGWLYRTEAGVTASHCVHASQGLRVHRPLPAQGDVVGTLQITGIDDKGPGKGALVHFQRELRCAVGGELLCTLPASMFCRADGGLRAQVGVLPPVSEALPVREPDAVFDLPTVPQQALLFRLSGDLNPLHADPEHARVAGFERPLLHGLSSYGAAAYALVRLFADGDATRLVAMDARFSKPVFPGECLRLEAWREARGCVRFRVRVAERGVTVLDQGSAEIVPAINSKT